MAEDIPSTETPDFEALLAELAAELAKAGPAEKRAILDRATVRPGKLPYMPALQPQGFGELRNSLSPEADRAVAAMGLPPSAGRAVDTLLKVEPITREFTGIPQLLRAGNAVGDVMIDPSIPNATNAGVQTALAVARPAMALKALGAGYAGALAKDIGGAPISEAEAQTPLTRTQRREMEMERQRAERRADIDRRAADADAARNLKTSAASKERDEYDRAVQTAETLRDRELGRERRFSDTTVGQVYDKTGGLAPFLAGTATGAMSRAATGGSILKDYALPAGLGTLAGIGMANVPLAYNALGTEPDNPQKRAAEVYARELPASHPRKQEFADFAARLPDANPIRAAAAAEFYDPEKLKERAIMGGAEGLLGGLMGADAPRLIGRATGAAGSSLRGLTDRLMPRGTAGRAADGIPSANALSTPPVSDVVSSAGIPPALAAERNALAGPEASPRQLPSPEASPSRPASDVPPGVGRDVNGVAYDLHTGHKIKKRLLEAPQSKPTPTSRAAKAKEEPTSEKITDPNDPAYWENRLTRGQ
jgi:hypothetical protein